MTDVLSPSDEKLVWQAAAMEGVVAVEKLDQELSPVEENKVSRVQPEHIVENEHELEAFKNVTMDDLEVMSILGVGTYGIVKLARHIPTGLSVALKIVSKEQIVCMRQQKHILRERDVHMSMNHPFVARLYATLQDEDCIYLVLEYLPGGELYHLLYSDANQDASLCNIHMDTGGITQDNARFYLSCIVLALEYFHGKDIIYRDLKLENLVLDKDGYPKVLDFGFAKRKLSSEKNYTLCGSMDYMAPEVLLHQAHDSRVDLWALGVVMYELIVGTTPFFHENQNEQGRMITTKELEFPDTIYVEQYPEACDLMNQLLQKDPEKRIKTCSDVKKHPFFNSMDWGALKSRKIEAPLVPQLSGPFDTSRFNIDEDIDDYVEPYDDDGSGWADDF